MCGGNDTPGGGREQRLSDSIREPFIFMFPEWQENKPGVLVWGNRLCCNLPACGDQSLLQLDVFMSQRRGRRQNGGKKPRSSVPSARPLLADFGTLPAILLEGSEKRGRVCVWERRGSVVCYRPGERERETPWRLPKAFDSRGEKYTHTKILKASCCLQKEVISGNGLPPPSPLPSVH